MKILGFGSNTSHNKSLIVEMDEGELEKLLGCYYAKCIPTLDRPVSSLRSGDVVDVRGISSMTSDLVDACEKFRKAGEAFQSTNETMFKFAQIVIKNQSEEAK